MEFLHPRQCALALRLAGVAGIHPAFHHWHHTKDGPAYINKNYAAIFPWVDKLFGSFYLPKQWPTKYGIDNPMAPGLARQLLQPFLQREKTSVVLVEPAALTTQLD